VALANRFRVDLRRPRRAALRFVHCNDAIARARLEIELEKRRLGTSTYYFSGVSGPSEAEFLRAAGVQHVLVAQATGAAATPMPRAGVNFRVH
jgi:hypothetical protein